jgi:hypothetical protein
MAKFKKKPVVIDAEVFNPPEVVPDGVLSDMLDANGRTVYYIKTLEGPLGCSPGDYIITGVKGEKYACKPDIFALTYEPVSE